MPLSDAPPIARTNNGPRTFTSSMTARGPAQPAPVTARPAPATPRPAPAPARPAPSAPRSGAAGPKTVNSRPAANARPTQFDGGGGNRSAFNPPRVPGSRPAPETQSGERADHDILFQHFFKSVGPRTYAAQVKKANNGNQYLVLTEGKRDNKTDEVRKTRLFVFSEDFEQFFDLVQKTADFIKANPLSPEFRAKRERYWAKQAAGANTPSGRPRT
jgi:hypothetical protein